MDNRSNGTSGQSSAFLESLILRAEEVLGKMLLKLQRTRIPLEEKVRMINALHAFVDQWEGALADVKLPPDLQQQLTATGTVAPSAAKSHGDEIMDVMRTLGLSGDDGGVGTGGIVKSSGGAGTGRSVVAVPVPQEDTEPVFEVLEQSLKEYYPGQRGTCFLTYTCPGSRRFFVLDRTDRDEADRVDRLLASLQNVTTRRENLPESPHRIFGIEVRGEIFRAVRSRSEPAWLWLLDTGAVLPFEESMMIFDLPEYYRRKDPYAQCCELVEVTDRKFRGGDLEKFLEQNLFSGREFEVVRLRGKVLHVSLGRAVSRKRSGVVKRFKPKEEAPPEYRISEKSLTQEQLDILYEEPLGTTNAMKATMGFVPQDDRRICPHYEPALEGCFKGSRCKLLHVAKDPDGWTRDQTLHKVKIRAQLNEPKVGSVVNMIPTTIVSVEEFYAHLEVQENSRKLVELQTLLNDPSNVKKFKPLDHKPYAREYVFARFTEDGQWYRAEVLDYFHDGMILVMYLDYGNQEHVRLDDLRTWDDGFDYLPFQAVLCRVANVTRKPVRDGEKEDIRGMLALREAIYDKRIAVKVLDIRSYWEVLVYDGSGMDIGEFLVKRKVALPREPIVIDDAEALIPA